MPVSQKPRRKLKSISLQKRMEKDSTIISGTRKILTLLNRATKGRVSYSEKSVAMLTLVKGY